MREFEDQVTTRDTPVDGVSPWYWLKRDTGAWDGPKTDFEDSHKHKWFTHVRDFDVCVQAGSCQGMYPRLLSRNFGVVYTFEPDRRNFYVASLNNQSENVYLFNAALGNGGFVHVNRTSEDNVGMHQTVADGVVPAMRLDSFNMPKLGLLALDIEGYELYALQGALETIQRCRPVITTECPNSDVRELLMSLGYAHEDTSVSDWVWIPSI